MLFYCAIRCTWNNLCHFLTTAHYRYTFIFNHFYNISTMFTNKISHFNFLLIVFCIYFKE